MEFKDRLKELRQNRGLSQDELSEKTGFVKSTISRYENGHRKSPGLNDLRRFAKYFNVTIDYLVGDTDDKDIYDDSEIISIFKKLTYDNKIQVLNYAKFILEGQNETSKA